MRSHSATTPLDDAPALILSNSTDATADYLCSRLAQADLPYRRFNTDAPLDGVHVRFSTIALEIEWADEVLRPQQIRGLIYRRPQPFEPPIQGDAYQRQHVADEWAETFEGFFAHIPHAKWINHPCSNFAASHKIHQLAAAHACGLIVPSWLVTTEPADARTFLDEHGSEVVAKPLAGGYIERQRPENDTLMYTQVINKSHSSLFDRLPACPVLFQQRVDKRADVRLVVIDDSIVATTLEAKEPNGSQRLDIRRDNMRNVEYAPVNVPDAISSSVRALMAEYRLRFAAMDFAIDSNGRWVFFEINPNGQWAWLDLVGATDLSTIFIDALRSGSRE